MSWVLEAVVAGGLFFAATNIDDLFILMLFFSQTGAVFRGRHVVVGQYLGFAALVALSVLGSLGILVVPEEWMGLMGVMPIFLRIRGLVRLRDESEEAKPTERSGIHDVAAVTSANGGDNIGIYVPLFASVGFARMGIIVFVFLALVAVWCYVGYRLGGHPTVADKVDRYGHIIVPFVLIGLGVYILGASGALRLLLG
ncbi:MAG: cadmium resistance transporter [Actinomycetota bacterium]|nr:cadmium resistance transporter [Actinomycetota bacterium]